MELGINTFFIDVNESHNLGLKRVEIVTTSKEKALSDAEKAYKYSMKYSIHLPVFLPEWFKSGQWDVFFCDSSPEKRELSFNLLEENLNFIKDFDAEYSISHFGGIMPLLPEEELESYSEIVNQSISRIETLAQKYGVNLLLEYFGLNKNLYKPEDWVGLVNKRNKLSLLLDTGHLYFSCFHNDLDLQASLKKLAPNATAFHIWNTKGSDHYWEYHHVAPNPSQNIVDGWAFSIPSLIQELNSYNPSAPLIIEPNVIFGGKEYIIESIKRMTEILETPHFQDCIIPNR